MKYAPLIFGGLILVSLLCLAKAGNKPNREHWVIDGEATGWGDDSTLLGWLTNLPIRAGENVTVNQTPTGTVISASGGIVTNRYSWIAADYLYTCPTESISNGNGRAVFTKHDKTRTDYAGPISCPIPAGYTSNITFRWYTYHTSPGTYAMACRWREGGLKAWNCATSALFQASTTLTNLAAADLAVSAPAPSSGLMEMEYWMVPTNAPDGGTAGGFGYVRGMKIEFGARL